MFGEATESNCNIPLFSVSRLYNPQGRGRRGRPPRRRLEGGVCRFVTAMMAFFLLMWLLNATTEEQRRGLADYFSPSNLLSRASSGSGQPVIAHLGSTTVS